MVRTAFEAAGAALLGLVLMVRLADGSILALVQSWYEPVLLGTAVVLLLAAVAAALPALRSGARWRPAISARTFIAAGLVAVPVVIGLAVQPQPLGSSSLDQDGAGQTNSLLGAAPSTGGDPVRRNVFEWAYLFETEAPATLIGEPVDLTGFVFHRDGAPEGQFEVARFVVACCVADASGYTLPVQWPEAATLPKDQWVQLQGSVATTATGALVVQATAVSLIDAPSNPYIYP